MVGETKTNKKGTWSKIEATLAQNKAIQQLFYTLNIKILFQLILNQNRYSKHMYVIGN